MKINNLVLCLMAVTTVLLFVGIPIIQYTYAQTTDTGISILGHTSYVGEIGDFHVIGEVRNDATKPMEFVEITATFYDSTGKVVGTESGFTDIDILRPSETSPFDILLNDEQQSKKIDN